MGMDRGPFERQSGYKPVVTLPLVLSPVENRFSDTIRVSLSQSELLFELFLNALKALLRRCSLLAVGRLITNISGVPLCLEYVSGRLKCEQYTIL